MKLSQVLGLVGLTLLWVSEASSESAQEKGLRIAQQAENAVGGYGDYTAEGSMILRDRSGKESQRRFSFKSLEGTSGDKTLLIFNWPGDIRNTALLTHSFSGRDDNQWLFLPAVRRAKRISGSSRSGSFVGSEFAYEDMVNQSVTKFDHTWIGLEPCGGLNCHVIDRVPRFSSGYSRQRVWLDTDALRIRKVDFYDRRGSVLKTLTAADYRKYSGGWRAHNLRMQNHLTGKLSILSWSNYRFGNGLGGGQFSVNALKSLR